MNAYSIGGWQNFFAAEVGAAAALTGLIFVAISINLNRIIGHPALPGQAGDALCKLGAILVIATIGLVPGMRLETTGALIGLVGLVAWLGCTVPQIRLLRRRLPEWNWLAHRRWILRRVITTQCATIPLMIAGISLVVDRGGGLYWLLPGVIFSFVGGIIGAWILLVEISR
jgi:hypothetical protein